MKLACFFAIFIIYSFCGYGQQLQQVAHCPSTEVYDLLVDKKGFLWVAHNLGISRYDGISFTSFSNPAQSSLSVTDLVEDNYGRIWCHNFNGQVFYIQHDKMYYLKEYDFRTEPTFPRMVLYGDELVVTSSTQKGLFVCNTATLKCRYASLAGNDRVNFKGVLSVCLLKNEVLAYGPNAWYTYTTKDGMKRLNNVAPLFTKEMSERAALQPDTFGDTAVIFNNAEGVLYGITLLPGNNLSVVFKKTLTASINSISVLNNIVWVNTKWGSFTLHGNDTLNGYNVTAMLYDKQGNKWISSLTNGLVAQYKTFNWKLVKIKQVPSDDPVYFIKRAGNWFLLSSRKEKIIATNNPVIENGGYVYSFPPEGGTIENIQAAESSRFFIETSTSLYFLNANKGYFFADSSHIGNIKDMSINNQTAYLALPASVQIVNTKAWKLQPSNKTAPPFSINDSLLYKVDNKTFLNKRMRCRAVLFDTATNSLLISFSDGLQRLKNNRLTFILYKGQPLYVSSMARHGNKIYAGTFNNGLFIIDGYKVRKVANNSESPQNAIVKIKRCNNHIWIFRSDDIEVLDAATEKFADIYPFPADIADITDVEEDSSNIYLAAHTGLFTIPTSTKVETVKADPSLLYVLVNNTDTIQQTDITLPANKNNLLFRLAIPVYKDADQLHFKYSLYNGGDTTGNTWYYTQDAQRDIQFNALKPGSYTLEITAMQDDREIANKHLVYNFTISRPWFSTWWFYTTVLLFTVSVSIAVYQYRLYQHVKMERMRRKISNDLHDDIGSTLSSINVYSQLAKGNFGNEGFIDTIQNNTVSIINNLDDLVWNINPKNDVLWQLVSRMKLFAESLLQEKGIECIFKVKLTEKDFVVSPNARAHLYLLFKEIINNIIKHSGSTKCSVYIMQKNKALRLTVTDNGRGFNVKNASQHRNGLRIMGERVKELKGELNINSAPGTGTEIKITCSLK